MEIAYEGAKVLHVDEVADLIESWRAEVTAAPARALEREHLASLLEWWKDASLEPMQLAYVLLGSEWLFRARLATGEDIRREVSRMQASLCNPRRGVFEADQAAIVMEALSPALVRELSQRRFLVSLERWAVREPLTRWKSWEAAKRGDPMRDPVPQVERKHGGRIPNLAPIVAGVVAEAIAQATRSADEAEALGIAVAELLLGRSVPAGEFRRWRAKLDQTNSHGGAVDSSAPAQPTMRTWVARRFRLGFSNQPGPQARSELMRQAREEPRRCFDPIASSEAVSALYALSWAGGSLPKEDRVEP